MVIFTDTYIESFKSANGMTLTFVPCELKTDEVGWMIDAVFIGEVQLKISNFRVVDESEIKRNTIIN